MFEVVAPTCVCTDRTDVSNGCSVSVVRTYVCIMIIEHMFVMYYPNVCSRLLAPDSVEQMFYVRPTGGCIERMFVVTWNVRTDVRLNEILDQGFVHNLFTYLYQYVYRYFIWSSYLTLII